MKKSIILALMGACLIPATFDSCSTGSCSKLKIHHTRVSWRPVRGRVVEALPMEVQLNESERRELAESMAQLAGGLMDVFGGSRKDSDNAADVARLVTTVAATAPGQQLTIQKLNSSRGTMTVTQPIYCELGPIQVGTEGRMGSYEGRLTFFPL